MKIRATRNFLNDVGMVRRGAEVDIGAVQARSLIKRGLATAIAGDEPKARRRSKDKGAKPDQGADASSEGE